MATSATKPALAATGGVVAAVVSTLCCAGPLVAVALGLSGAGLAATFEPLRPYFVAGTVLALGFGFVVVRGEEKRACEPGTLCASPIARRRSEEHTSELQSPCNLVCRLLLEKKKYTSYMISSSG